MNFNQLKLVSPLLKSLEEAGYKNPTPIQEKAIPALLEGRDLLGIAQTGTGKTAAFSLPILNHLAVNKKQTKNRETRVLIITPTRELASQISENIAKYGNGIAFKQLVVFGGVNQNKQINAMSKGMDILVATPGRLLDLMNQGAIRANDLEILVLDEADRMLDMGFITDIKKILKLIKGKRQTLFFSATMPKDIEALSRNLLKNPVRVEVTPPSTTVSKIDQSLYFIDKRRKAYLLKFLITELKVGQTLVFTKTKHGANRLVKKLESFHIQSAAIHGNKSQSAREKALADFKAFKIKVLVATDIAARGIDISTITHVFNYDLPMEPESYVHRIGRTARAKREGMAISFCEDAERKLLVAIQKNIGQQIPLKDVPAEVISIKLIDPPVHNQGPRNRTTNKSESKNTQVKKKSQSSRRKKTNFNR